MRIRITLWTFLLSILMCGNLSAQEKLPLVYGVENTGADFPAPALPSINDLPSIPNLPDPFAWADGRGRITNFSDWEYKRQEIGKQILNYEIGEKPVRPDSITASYSGGTLTVNVTKNGQTLTLTSQVLLPAGTGPFSAVIGMNSSSGSIPADVFTSRNIARITFNHNQVTTYNNYKITDPFFRLYPNQNTTNTGQYAIWAWGVSRIIDGLELVQGTLPIDLKHIAVTGCSYAGKMALFCGAFDERIALTISQESGGGGYTTWRVSELKAGEVETLEATNYSWFSTSRMKPFSGFVPKLPIDHHELMAMVAPRALLVTGNPSQIWLSDTSGYVGSKAAKEVWNALGIPERFGYSIVTDHAHCAVPNSQIPEIAAMVDKFLLGKDTSINVSTSWIATVNLAPWITWSTPTLSSGSSSIRWAPLNYPSDLKTDMDTVITFKWNKVQNAQKYVIQVSLDPSFATVYKTDSTTTDTIKTFTGLLKGKTYYWRVKVQSTADVNLWSNVWSFKTTTPLPATPQLVSVVPTFANRADVITYTWNTVQYADQYLVQVSKEPTFATLFKTSTTSDTLKSISGHTKGDSYYWRVQATSFAGTGPWSTVGNFTANITDVNEEKGGIPTDYSLSQNYPNPFNPSTIISYQLPVSNHVTLTVYDALGREVAVLVSEAKEAGYYSAPFDAAGLSSGIYFAKLQSGDKVQLKKMVLMK